MDNSVNKFIELSKINVNDKASLKNKFTYLSWSHAVTELMRLDPSANWVFHDPKMFGQTMMVSCTVTAFNKPVYMWLPVMDYSNKAVANPDAVAVNKAMMRCLVKGIAAHGLGLYIYAGEDLPDERDINVNQQVQPAPAQKPSLSDDRLTGAIAAIKDDSKPDWTMDRVINEYSLTAKQLEHLKKEVNNDFAV